MSARPPLPPTHPADTSVLDSSVDMQHVPDQPLDQSAFVCGNVTYRTGDGPLLTVRQGPVKVAVGEFDVTLGWEEEGNRMSAVMPRTEYARFIGEGAVKPVVTHRPDEPPDAAVSTAQ